MSFLCSLSSAAHIGFSGSGSISAGKAIFRAGVWRGGKSMGLSLRVTRSCRAFSGQDDAALGPIPLPWRGCRDGRPVQLT